MVKASQTFQYLADGSIDTANWLQRISTQYALSDVTLLAKACAFTANFTQGLTTLYGSACLQQGLEVAEVLLHLELNQETAAAGIVSCAIHLTDTSVDAIKQELGDTIAKLVVAVKQMDSIPVLQRNQQDRAKLQLDKTRKMLLAMATDIRVVIIKLAERLCFMRGIKSIAPDERKRFAEEVLDIYAPLANRLGIGQLKWELEDLAFHYLDPVTYKTIATFLSQRRVDREQRIEQIVRDLQEKLTAANVKADVTGRAKHIYSIYLKAQRKDLHYKDIYDQMAVRILVSTIEECYVALSVVHSLWPPIIKEFDDYIANPKGNGYRSIHTAVIGEDGRHFEIQIRTHAMHEEAERGVAAHWIYKENKTEEAQDHAAKIAYLRQLLDWHKEIANTAPANAQSLSLLDDQVYVTTPAGDILDLPKGATPIDFAYYVHSELGNRCRGAKVNGQIVPLTYMLRTGDKVEILTSLQGAPSRDWLNPEHGYIKTTRARSKVSHWFKQEALKQDIEAGRELLERELARHGLSKASLTTITRLLQIKSEDALLAGLGRGNIRIGQVLQALHPKVEEKISPQIMLVQAPKERSQSASITGASDFLTRFAKCCKPIPGDEIIGYITQGRGISVHKKNCNNVKHFSDPQRFIQIHWDKQQASVFNTGLKIIAQDSEKILNDLTALLANEKVSLLSFNSTLNSSQGRFFITMDIQIQDITQLQRLLHRIQQLPGIIEVSR